LQYYYNDEITGREVVVEGYGPAIWSILQGEWHFPNLLLSRRELKDPARLFDLRRGQSSLGARR